MIRFFPCFQVQPVQPLNGIDIIGSVLFFTLLITETCADQQQWNFQTQKYALKNAGKELVPPYDVGFCRSGTYIYLNLGRNVGRPENLRGGVVAIQDLKNLMPCPFTGPKMFCASPNVFEPVKNFIAFNASSKTFVPAQKTILLNANHLLVWDKTFVTGTICE